MIVDVAAAVIQRPDGSFLLAQRPAGKVYAGWWEFPGGKIEAGEPPAAALARELHEELGLEVKTAYPWLTRVFEYPHGTVRLRFFRVLAWSGEPQSREEQKIHWQKPGEQSIEPMLPANAPVLAALALPDEYAITDAERHGIDDSLKLLARRLHGGLRLLQVRDKNLADRSGFARKVVELAHRHGARVLINGGPAIADGIHFTAQQLMALDARPQGGLAAASCHNEEELARAMALGMDFAVLGPVKDKAAIGWERFAALAKDASLPLYAIGGLRRTDFAEAWRAGAHGLAMIRGSWD